MVEAARGRGTNPALRIEGVRKRYRNNVAVDAVSLEVEKGELVSLLGPNGAGKSTLMDMIAGVVRPDQGDVWVMGHSLRQAPMAVRAALGVVPQDLALYPDLSARENLQFWGRMYGLGGARLARRTADLLEVVGLVERQRDRVETFSGGMKRRLNIAAALLHEPPVIMLDEPTVGIDPQSRRAILDYVRRLNDEGATVLYTTHYMEEAAELSDRIAILDRGRIIAQGTHEALTRIVGEHDRVELELSEAGIGRCGRVRRSPWGPARLRAGPEARVACERRPHPAARSVHTCRRTRYRGPLGDPARAGSRVGVPAPHRPRPEGLSP